MSIGKRLLDLARANLTDFRQAFSADHLRELLNTGGDDDEDDRADRERADAAGPEPEPDPASVGARAGRGARRFKDAAEEAWERAYERARQGAGVRGDPPSDPAAERRKWYKALDVAPGSDLKTVRRAYRKMLLKYHPDKFHSDPDKLAAATEVTRKLTEAYNGLSRYLGG